MTTALIMAAGQGSRMRSELPKVLHPLCGRPLVLWPVIAAQQAGVEKIVVISSPDVPLEEVLPAGVELTVQQQPRGTGDAVKSAAEFIKPGDQVVILSGDSPLITAAEIEELVDQHTSSGSVATLLTTELEDPASYGRVVRNGDGGFEQIVEAKVSGDASAEQLEIKEINTGTYCFNGEQLLAELEALTPNNAQAEYYIGDLFAALVSKGSPVLAHKISDSDFALGVNNRVDLALVTEIANSRILEAHMLAGVTISDPASTRVDVDVEIEADTTLGPYCFLSGATRIAAKATVGPMVTAVDAVIGAGSQVMHSYLDSCRIGSNCCVGPFAYLRPQAELADGVKIGAFVEVKNSTVGAGTKIPHLSYIGDAEIGAGSNIGAGNITANYDGSSKHKTVIGSNVKTGVDTALVAPVILGDNVYTGAGSVITEDVPDGALAISRTEQKNVRDYAERKKSEEGESGP